ncbi:hypothetical protein STVIR_7393 [Streptomyces viridochromogenes Tue57]|uniref:Uncharacterized protein n=1 Tax=Streptomyces viridochromogenes Tue57 TaxID=1160705 RepID=L8P262_STRVR|nr:hypothetical protein STVIR_7393 [Streptomyces viridochromogenes Tue57]
MPRVGKTYRSVPAGGPLVSGALAHLRRDYVVRRV